MTIRTLLGLLIISLTVYGLTRLFSSKPERTFSANLVQIDTTQVTSIVILLKGGKSEITLKKENQDWIASNGQIHLKVEAAKISRLLNALTAITTRKIVAKSRQQWSNYGVSDAQSTRVWVYAQEQLLEDFRVGNVELKPTPSYLRLTNEEEVYAVDGSLAAIFGQDFNFYRNRNLLQLAGEMEVTTFDYQSSDSILHFIKNNQDWLQDTVRLDAAKVEDYLNGLKNISGETFADDFDEVQGTKYVYQVITLQVKDISEPFILTCYRDTMRNPPFILHSNQNPEAFFISDSTGIYNQIFREVNGFIKKRLN